MTAPPARRQQLQFWLIGRRLPPEHRPWVAEQVTDPRYNRRRLRYVVAIQLVLVVLPQLLLSFAGNVRAHLLIAGVGAATAGIAALVLARRPLPGWQRQWLLAYHGVTADGRLVPPQSFVHSNPLGRAGLALVMAQVLLFTSGIAVAFHLSSSAMRCRPAPAAAVAALQDALGRPGIGFAAPPPARFEGARLAGAQRVDGGLDGVYYVAAFVRGVFTPENGNGVGPAVWRVIEPGGVFPVDRISTSAADLIAREVTPSLGYSYDSPPDPRVERARECALQQV